MTADVETYISEGVAIAAITFIFNVLASMLTRKTDQADARSAAQITADVSMQELANGTVQDLLTTYKTQVEGMAGQLRDMAAHIDRQDARIKHLEEQNEIDRRGRLTAEEECHKQRIRADSLEAENGRLKTQVSNVGLRHGLLASTLAVAVETDEKVAQEMERIEQERPHDER